MYNRSLLSQNNSPNLLNDPHIYNRPLLSQNDFPYLLNDPCYFQLSFQDFKISILKIYDLISY